MPHGKKNVNRPKGPKANNAEMNGITRFLPNGDVQPVDNGYDPKYADMPPLEDIDLSCLRNEGAETALFDKYNSLPKVIVSHFPYGVSEAQLLAIFEEFNPIMCRIMINAPTPVVVNASSACIYFKDERDAAAALKLDRTLYKNYIIEVKQVTSILF